MPLKKTPPLLKTCFIKGRGGGGEPRKSGTSHVSPKSSCKRNKKIKKIDFRLKEKALLVIQSEMSPAADWLKGKFVDEPHSCS